MMGRWGHHPERSNSNSKCDCFYKTIYSHNRKTEKSNFIKEFLDLLPFIVLNSGEVGSANAKATTDGMLFLPEATTSCIAMQIL